VWIAGSFANFTDIQATVNGVLAAIADLDLRVPVVIRRDGPNADAAKADAEQWAKDHGVTLQFHRADTDMDASARAVVELMNKV
jgi:succinyl-CoA synthetase beta subunit